MNRGETIDRDFFLIAEGYFTSLTSGHPSRKMVQVEESAQILGLYKERGTTIWSVSRKVVTKNTKCQEPTKFASKHQKLTWPQSKYTGHN